MLKLGVVYLLITAALLAIAIYVQVASSTLTFPISMGTTILTILLPLIGAANLFYSPLLHRILQRQTGSVLVRQLAFPTLQIIQGVLTVIIITLSFQGFLPGQNLTCGLEGNWQRLWSAHDGRAIERIQDAFNCCGLRTIKDKAWPQGQCSQLYNRHVPCAGLWRGAMQRTSGLEFAVATVVGIIQLVQLIMFRLNSAGGGGIARRYRQITQSDSIAQTEGLVEDDEEEETEGAGDHDGNGNGNNPSRPGYSAIDGGRGPRVEPSHLSEERNHWRT